MLVFLRDEVGPRELWQSIRILYLIFFIILIIIDILALVQATLTKKVFFDLIKAKLNGYDKVMKVCKILIATFLGIAVVMSAAFFGLG